LDPETCDSSRITTAPPGRGGVKNDARCYLLRIGIPRITDIVKCAYSVIVNSSGRTNVPVRSHVRVVVATPVNVMSSALRSMLNPFSLQ